jgi:hypothetical protein
MTTLKMTLALILTATTAVACVGDADDVAEDGSIDSVEAALDARDRGDERVRWEDERRPCDDCRVDGAHEFRGCVTLRRLANNRRVLRWLGDRDISELECDERDRDGLPYYRSR